MPHMTLSTRVSRFQHDRATSAGGKPPGVAALRGRDRVLEERMLLSIDMVENSSDSGPGSLRNMIASAAAGSTIEFDLTPGHVTSQITLTTGQIVIPHNLKMVGPARGWTDNQREFVEKDIRSAVRSRRDHLRTDIGRWKCRVRRCRRQHQRLGETGRRRIHQQPGRACPAGRSSTTGAR